MSQNLLNRATDDRSEAMRQICHDLRGSMTVVTTAFEILPAVRDDPEAFAAALEEVRGGGIEPMKKIIDDLADLAESAR